MEQNVDKDKNSRYNEQRELISWGEKFDMIELVKAHELFLKEENMPILELEKEDYEIRIARLVERIREKNLTHMVIYGDREHFSNVEYFTRYDCRFEETLFIVDAEGKKSIILGN